MRVLSFDNHNDNTRAVEEANKKENNKKKKMPKGWLPRVALEIVPKPLIKGGVTVTPPVEEKEGNKGVGYKFRKPTMIKSSVSGGGGVKTKSIMQVKREQERALKAVLEQASFHL